MYKMIGGDAREYGPVSADQIREWIADNRANGQTLVQAEGTTDWRPLSSLPEFAEALGQLAASAAPPPQTNVPPAVGTPAPITPIAPQPSPLPAGGSSGDAFNDVHLHIGDCLGHGWLLLGRHFALLTSACFVVWLIVTTASFIPIVGGLVLGPVLSGALYGGLAVLCLRLIRQEETSLADLFQFFGPHFVQLMLVWIVVHALCWFGRLFCEIPGLILQVLWVFSIVLVADRHMDFWPAIKLSGRVSGGQFFGVAVLLIVAWLPSIVFEAYTNYRVYEFMLGRFGPVSTWAFPSILDTFRSNLKDYVQFAGRLELERQLVFFLNLPFATATVLHAYEVFFGKGRTETAR